MSKNPYDVPDIVKIKIDAIGNDFADFPNVDYTCRRNRNGYRCNGRYPCNA